MARKLVSDLRNVPLVTSLPTSPNDGMEVYYRFTQTVGPVSAVIKVWHLMWIAAANAWIPVGVQEPVSANDPVLQSVAFGANAWGTPSPSVSATAPLPGTYRIKFGVPQFWNSSANGNWYVGALLTGAAGNRYPGNTTSTTANNLECATGMSGSSYTGAHGVVNLALSAATYMSVYLYEFFTASTTAYTGGRYVELYPISITGN